ncbi:MAG TPA: pyruvate kinase [Cyclobacteriaceae bacterium]
MKIKPDKINKIIKELDDILANIKKEEKKCADFLGLVCNEYKKSANNLVHYRGLRKKDITSLQKKLGHMGLSRLAKAEAHLKASILTNKFILQKLIDEDGKQSAKSGLSIKNGQKLLSKHTTDLLGFRSRGRRVRIMVTLPSETASDYQIVHDLVASGMNVARINCAHDTEADWLKMIEHIKMASKKLHKGVKISMDLAGPKIRTGKIIPGPKVKKFRPDRDSFGRTIHPASIRLVGNAALRANNEIPVDDQWLKTLKINDQISFEDTRGKYRTISIWALERDAVIAHSYDTCYIATGTKFYNGAHDTEVGELPYHEESLNIHQNDRVKLCKDIMDGQPAQYDKDGNLLRHARLSSTLPEIVDELKVNEKVMFDDGKITGVVEEKSDSVAIIRITHAKGGSASLKADKGINMPQTKLNIPGLTDKDKKDLRFVAQHADIVNFSFVNHPDDVKLLLKELEFLGVKDKIGIILKIETQRAFNNLTDILLTAMQTGPIGVMIARGDLAIETGWENIGRVQNEILGLCSAGHIPVVWATQVLENLAKKGIPSRSEITDAASSLQAECVMLNKGPFINQAITLLDTILRDMDHYIDKRAPLLPELEEF